MRSLFTIAIVGLILFALPGVAIFAADLAGYEVEVNGWLESRFSVSHHVAVTLPAAMVLFCVPPLIILLYFLRLRRKPISVSSTYLWKKSIEDLHVNRLMQWLRRNVLLLLQLLGAFALIYAALGPRLHGSVTGGRYYILLVDNSASMSATDIVPDRLAWAKLQAIREIEAATDGDFGMVIAFNSTAEILQSYTNDRGALKAAVAQIQPTRKPTRIDEALGLAASLANPEKSSENEATAPANPEPGKERTYVPIEGISADVHLYSDGKFPSPDFALANLNLNYHTPPGANPKSTSNNLAIARIDIDRGWQKAPPDDAENAVDDPTPSVNDRDADDTTKLTVAVTVRNYRAVVADKLKVRLELLDGDGELRKSYSRTLRLNSKTEQAVRGKTVYFYLPDVPEGSDVILHAKLEAANDIFLLDDEAWAVLGIVRKAKILVVSPDNNFLLRAVLDSPAQKKIANVTYLPPSVLTDAKRYLAPARDGKWDLVIFDRCGPDTEDRMPSANTLFIGYPPPPFLPTGTDARSVLPVKFPSVQGTLDRHPIVQNLRGLYDIGIDESFRLPELPGGTLKLMEAANGHVLLAGIPRRSFTDLILCFAILTADEKWNTRWPLEPSFVLFLRNIVMNLGNVRDAGHEDPTLPGQEKVLHPGGVKQITVQKPSGLRKSFERGTRPDFAFTDTTEIGIYTATWTDGNGDNATHRFAVNLFPEGPHDESDLAPINEVKIGAQTIVADKPRKQPRDLWKLAVIAGLIVLMAEWWIYNKRVQI